MIRKMENTKGTVKNARRSSNGCKEQRNTSCRTRKPGRKVVNPTRFQNTKHACIVEAHESTRQRLESSLPKDHEDHIAGKGYNSMTHYNLVHKFVPVPQAMKIPDAKAAMDKEWKKLETISSLATGESREQERGFS